MRFWRWSTTEAPASLPEPSQSSYGPVSIGAYEVAGFEWAALDLLGGWKWLLPFAVLLMSALHIQDSWLTRHKAFKTISSSLVARNVSTGASRIAFGALFGSSVYGLIAGYFLGLICRFAVQASAVRDGLRATFSDIGWPATKEIARRYSDFPKFNAPAGLVFSMGQNLPVLMFGVMFSPVMAGLYAMADRLSQVPVTIVATSVRRVFMQKASEIDNRGGSLRKAFLLSTGALALVGTVPFACLWLFGQPLATWILGDRWLVAGQYLEILAPWLFLVWSAAPCNAIFVVLRKQKFWLSLTATITMLRLGVFGYAHLISAGPERTLKAFVLASVIGILITITTTLVLVLRHTPQNSPTVDIAE